MQRIRNIFFLVSCLFAATVVVFCLYYLLHSHAALLADYQELHSCFYRASRFPDFFTPAVKEQGNRYCILAIALLPVTCFAVYKNGNKIHLPRTGHLQNSYSAVALLLLSGLAAGMVTWNVNHLAPATDEVFSAVNFASAPLSRLLSWYPLPNHHIGFNLLNHMAGAIVGDYLLSGRILSGICYYLLLAGSFLFLYARTKNACLSFVAVLSISLQFMLWGFGSQARGYALFYVLEWTAFVSLFQYLRHPGYDTKWLFLLLCCNAAGMFTIPSFAYCILFQLMAVTGTLLYRRQFNSSFLKVLLYTAVLVFLLYLPMFCYSGIAAVAANKYVYGSGQSSISVFGSWWQVFREVVLPATWGVPPGMQWLGLLCFMAPVLLWLSLRKRLPAYTGLLVYLYSCLWLSAFAMVLLQRQIPVIRTLGGHMQISLLILLLLLAELVLSYKHRPVYMAAYILVCVSFITLFLCYNRQHKDIDLYGQNTAAHWESLQQLAAMAPEQSKVWISEESFMWSYVLQYRKLQVAGPGCQFNTQQLLIISEDDTPLPAGVREGYHVLGQSGQYTILEHNNR